MKKIIGLLALVLLTPLFSQTVMAKPASPVQVGQHKAKKTVKKRTTSAKQEIIATYSKISYVVMNKKAYLVNSNNQKTKHLAQKKRGYRIYYVRYSGSKIYYGLKNKEWLLATNTRGTVWYKEDNFNTMVLTTNKKGQLSYQLYSPVNTKQVVLTRNSYVYNDQGLLDKGTVVTLKKGTKITVYQTRTINDTKFYISNQGWIKARNTMIPKQMIKKPKKK